MILIGVDVGGTFTDLVMLDTEGGQVTTRKVSSTPDDVAHGFMEGIERLGVAPRSIARLLHGTTVATNAAIERKGARTAGVFTKGFRDVLAIGNGQRLTGGLFDPAFVRAAPLIPRTLRLEVRERTYHDGRVLGELNEDDLAAVAGALERQCVEAVAICFLHAYANEAHEAAAERFLRERLRGAFICRSGDVLPQIREYERFTTTVFNAYLGPVMQRYLSALGGRLAAAGYGRDLLLMTSNGGVVSGGYASRYPATTVLSGPAGGVSAGTYLGRRLGVDDLITYDMGGTSTDVCLVKGLGPALARQRIVGGLPLKLPQLEINTIGAGGGSLAHVDPDGTFRVGPESAGAAPGPACYGRGGAQATVTDANLVLGRIGGETRLAGFLGLDRSLALAAVEHLRDRLGLDDVHRAAEGIIRLVVSGMAGAIREISIERGEDPRPYALLAFGGAGPMHACLVARELEIVRVIVPMHPGNFSALGLLASDLRHELVRSHLALLETADLGGVRGLLDAMAGDGRRLLAEDGVAEGDMDVRGILDMRYCGQAHELPVEAEPGALDREALAARFRRRYIETWAHEPDARIQIVSLRVTAVGRAPRFELSAPNPGSGAAAPAGRRSVYFDGRFHETPVYWRWTLPVGARVTGPAIVDEEGSTTVVPPHWRLEVHASGALFLSPS